MSPKRDGMGSPEAPPSSLTAVPIGGNHTMREVLQNEASISEGHVLYQASFFFCTVKMVGDIPGAGSIYVEIVVDRDSGIAFAKVYSARNSINGVDILASRVLPYFCKQGQAMQEIRTRNTNEYCGLTPRHAYQAFLAVSHIQHAVINGADDPYDYLCEQFYGFLLKEFFQPALRATFEISLVKLQRNLDNFLKLFNSGRHLRKDHTQAATPKQNFAVDL